MRDVQSPAGVMRRAEKWRQMLMLPRWTARRADGDPKASPGWEGYVRALRDVFLETREQRCWFHRSSIVLNLRMFLPHCRNRRIGCARGHEGHLHGRGDQQSATGGEGIRNRLRRKVEARLTAWLYQRAADADQTNSVETEARQVVALTR